jgi:hypothetical protein
MPSRLKPEQLAQWYFRLNGFFTIPNFVLHPQTRGSARTDADIAGVRFSDRAEFPQGKGGDDPEFLKIRNKPYAVLAEIKTARCKINGPWSKSEFGNVCQVLADLGLYPTKEVEQAATSLHEQGVFDGTRLYCTLFCVGNRKSSQVTRRYPKVPQRTWTDIATFLFCRFGEHRLRKTDHDSWDDTGKLLWNKFDGSKDRVAFEREVRAAFGLPVP